MQEKVNKFSNIKERVIYFIENQSIKKEFFFNNIGITSANFRGNAQKTPLNSNAIENIITKYPEINLQWLVTGKGEMLIDIVSKKTNEDTNVSEIESFFKSKNVFKEIFERLERLEDIQETLLISSVVNEEVDEILNKNRNNISL